MSWDPSCLYGPCDATPREQLDQVVSHLTRVTDALLDLKIRASGLADQVDWQSSTADHYRAGADALASRVSRLRDEALNARALAQDARTLADFAALQGAW